MRRLWLTTFAIAALGTGGLRAQEIQVPADEAGRIQVITDELARRVGLFGEVEGFREARLFQLADGSFVLEITSDLGGGLRRERRPLSAAQAAEFRRDLTARISARAPTAVLDQGGRTKLLVGSTLLGLGFYGWATEEAFDPTDDQTAVALYMLTAASAFFVPFLATRSVTVSDAAASMTLWGATRGAVHGYLGSFLGDAEKDKTRFAWTVTLGATEAIAGGLIGHALGMTPGEAEMTGAGGDIGLGVGFAVANLLKLDDRYRDVTVVNPGFPSFTYQVNDRTLQSAAMLTTSGLGLASGYLLARTGEWTRGDAWVFRNVGLLGGLAGLAVGDIIQQPKLVTFEYPDGSTSSEYQDGYTSTHSAAGLIGTAAGVVLGRTLVSGRNFSTGQGTLLSLSPLAGGLLGLGIAYLAAPDETYFYDPTQPYRDPNDHSELYLTASAVGAGLGFAALYPAMAKQAKGATLGSNLQFSVNPLAAAQVLRRDSRSGVPLASITYRF